MSVHRNWSLHWFLITKFCTDAFQPLIEIMCSSVTMYCDAAFVPSVIILMYTIIYVMCYGSLSCYASMHMHQRHIIVSVCVLYMHVCACVCDSNFLENAKNQMLVSAVHTHSIALSFRVKVLFYSYGVIYLSQMLPK